MRVGDRISLLFEDRATVWYQTQEMVWVEHITDLDAIRDELAVYGALLPGRSELSATLLIEITEHARIRDELGRLRGIDRARVARRRGGARRRRLRDGPREREQAVGGAVRPVPARDGDAGPRSSTARRCTIVVDHPGYPLLGPGAGGRAPQSRGGAGRRGGVAAPRCDGCAMAEGVREGRRTTPQLAVVLEAVRTSGAEHPTAERIYDRVRRVLPSISLGTVYRNLQRLVQEGQIGAAQLGARSLHYDPTATPHDHFVCRRLRPRRGPDGRCARAAARSGAPRGSCRDLAHARALRPVPELPGVDMRLPDIIPLFPLPNVVFFPRMPLPLHIFEPRYRAMVRDAVKGARLIGMVLLRGDWQEDYAGTPEIFGVGHGRRAGTERGAAGRTLRHRAARAARVRDPPRADAGALPGGRGELARAAARRPPAAGCEPGSARSSCATCSAPAAPAPRPELVETGVDDETFVNFLAQHLDLDPLEKQALLEAASLGRAGSPAGRRPRVPPRGAAPRPRRPAGRRPH